MCLTHSNPGILCCASWVCHSDELCWISDAWITRRSNQSILKEINPEYSLKGLMLKLKLQYFSHLMWRGNSLEKTLMLGNIEGRRRRRWQRMRWLNGITDSMDLGLSKLWEMVKDRETFHTTVCGLQRVRHDWETEQQLMLSQWFNILWWAVLSQYY